MIVTGISRRSAGTDLAGAMALPEVQDHLAATDLLDAGPQAKLSSRVTSRCDRTR